MQTVEVSIVDKGDVIIINLRGEFNIRNLKKVEGVWNDQIAKRPRIIAIDCQQLSYIDSSAIGQLVKFLNTAMSKKIELIFYDLSDGIRDMFANSRLNRFFKIIKRKTTTLWI